MKGFGFEEDTELAASITSDTAVYGLDDEEPFIDETASVVLSDVDDTARIFSVDEALRIVTSAPANDLNVTAVVTYEELV